MPMQPGDVYETEAKVDKLIEVTGFRPEVSIDDGIRRFVNWYLREYLPLGLADAPHFPLPVPVQSSYPNAASTIREVGS